jgi:hypothetical protein
MYGSDEYEVLHQCPEEIRQEVAVVRLEKMARANCETRSYVARDLSWELARYLNTSIRRPTRQAPQRHRVARAETESGGRPRSKRITSSDHRAQEGRSKP